VRIFEFLHLFVEEASALLQHVLQVVDDGGLPAALVKVVTITDDEDA